MMKNIVGLFLLGGLVVSMWINVIQFTAGKWAQAAQASDMVSLINRSRELNKLPPLTENSQLDKSATAKACDMKDKDYFEHVRPDGKTPWAFIKESGYKYKVAGENIAEGYSGATDNMVSFLASPGHRENVLDPRYKEVGIGYCGVYVVQHFGTQ